MKSLTLEGNVRDQFGSTQSQRLRRENLVPCVIYGGSETVNFHAPYNTFQKIVYNPEFFTIKITVDGKEYNTIIKEAQFHPVTDKIMHIDFLELNPGRKVTAEIPVKLVGQSVGVKEGGKLIQKIYKMKIKAYPQDLIEQIEVKVENLDKGKSIRVADVKLENIEILNSSHNPIASVEIPRAAAVTDTAAAGAAPAAAAKPAAGAKPAEEKKAEPAKAEKKPEAKK